jgi:hypothetical protein
MALCKFGGNIKKFLPQVGRCHGHDTLAGRIKVRKPSRRQWQSGHAIEMQSKEPALVEFPGLIQSEYAHPERQQIAPRPRFRRGICHHGNRRPDAQAVADMAQTWLTGAF